MGHQRNILTLQFGHFANLAGAHFWNMQDEAAGLGETENFEALRDVDQGALYYEVDLRKSTAYRPRVVIFDVRGSLGAFTNEIEAEVPEEDSNLWGGSVDIFRAPKVSLHPMAKELGWADEVHGDFLRYNRTDDDNEEDYDGEEEDPDQRAASDDEEAAAEGQGDESMAEKKTPTTENAPDAEMDAAVGSVTKSAGRKRFFFTDFLQAEIPVRSTVQLTTNLCADVPSFFSGRANDLTTSERDAIEDALRFQLEHSDRVESIQALWDTTSPMSAHVRRVMQYLSEETPKASCLYVPMRHPDSRPPNVEGALNPLGDLDEAMRRSVAEKGGAEASEVLLEVEAKAASQRAVQRERAERLQAAGAALSLVEAMDCDLEHMVAPMDIASWGLEEYFGGHGHMDAIDFAKNDFAASALAATAIDGLSLPGRLHAGGVAGGFNGLNRLVSAPHETLAGVSIALPMPRGLPKKKATQAPPEGLRGRGRQLFAAAFPEEKEEPVYWRELCSVARGVDEKIFHSHQYVSARIDSFETMGRVVGLAPDAVAKSMWMLGAQMPLAASFPKQTLFSPFMPNRTSFDDLNAICNAVRVHNARAGGGSASVKQWCEQFSALRYRPDFSEIASLSGIEADEWGHKKHLMEEHDLFGVDNEASSFDSDDSSM